MSLQKHLNYDARTDIFEGFKDFDNNRATSSHQLCNQAMAVIIKGLYLDFKQIIGYFLNMKAMVANNFKDILLEIIEKVSQTGFLIKTIVCDLGSNNVKLRRLLSVIVTDPYITYEEKIVFLYDAPHLLKCVRNNLKKYDFQHKDEILSWSHIPQFYSILSTNT